MVKKWPLYIFLWQIVVLYEIYKEKYLRLRIIISTCYIHQQNSLFYMLKNIFWSQMKVRVRVMVSNVTFNNISIIPWWQALLVDETGVSGENHRPVESHWQTLSHNVVLSTPHLNVIWTHNVSGDRFRFMVFYATFNNISVISWWQVLLVEETGIPGENHWSVASHWQTLSHKVVSCTLRYEWDSNSF